LTTINLVFDDTELAQALKKGEQEAYEYIFRTYYNSLCRYAVTFLREPNIAEEMVQDCFCTLYLKRKSLQINQSLKFYLFQMVRNRCLNHLKQEKIRQGKLALLHEDLRNREDFFDLVSDASRNHELQKKIRAAVEQLPQQCRKVFELGKYSGLSYPEIANELEVSVKTVEKHMSKALSILREELSGKLFLVLLFSSFLGT